MRKQRKKHSFISIFFIIVLIIIICISIKMLLSILEEQNIKKENITSNTIDYEVSSETKNNEIIVLPEESVKIESPKKRESRAIKLAKGEKSNNNLSLKTPIKYLEISLDSNLEQALNNCIKDLNQGFKYIIYLY